MKAKGITNSISLRLLNQNRILNLLFKSGSLTQAEIKEKSGLSGPTVIQCIQHYKEEGIFVEGETLASSGGRKPLLINFNYNHRYAVGVEIRKHHIDISIMNLKGECIASKNHRLVFDRSFEYLQKVDELVCSLVDENVKPEKVLGVGIAFPGEISLDGEEILRSTVLGIHNVPIKRFVDAFHFPVNVEYGPNAAAFGAVFRNRALKDALYIVVTENGIAGSVVVNKKIYRGHSGKAGAFGHITLDPNGRLCDCGRRGCWSACNALKVLTNNDEIKLKDFFDRVKEGDTEAKKILDQYLLDFSHGIINVRLAYDTDVIIGGKLVPYLKDYMDVIKKNVFDYPVLQDDVFDITLDTSSNSPMSEGAAMMMISSFLDKN